MSDLTEFRLHGRGGQGIVMAAAVFAEAVFRDGLFARAFSLFGAERRGAPVTAFVRAGKDKLMPRCRVYRPDYVAVLDKTLNEKAVLDGLKDDGQLLLNGGEESSLQLDIPTGSCIQIHLVDAEAIARSHNLIIGTVPAVNMVMVGALARISGLASLESVLAAVEKRVLARQDDNLKAAADGYNNVEEVARVG